MTKGSDPKMAMSEAVEEDAEAEELSGGIHRSREGRCPTLRQWGQLVLPNAMLRACSSRAGIVLPTACFPQL